MKSSRWLMMVLLPVCVLSWCVTGRAAERAGMVVGLEHRAVAVQTDSRTRDLAIRAAVFVGETLRTDKGSKLQVMLEDDSLISLGEDSELTLDEYVFSPDAKKKNGLTVRIGKGLARIITGIIADLNPDQFRVRTSRATIGIRGCELGFLCMDDEHRYFVVRVPEGRAIHVVSDVRGEEAIFREPGFVEVDEHGRLRRGFLQDQDVRDLLNQTTPGFARNGDVPTQQGVGERGAKRVFGETELPVAGMETFGQMSYASESLPMTEMARLETDFDPVQTIQDVHLSSTVTEDRGDQVLPSVSLPPPPPPPSTPPPPLPSPSPSPVYPPIKGKGGGGQYLQSAAWVDLDSMVHYYSAFGFIRDGRTSVDFLGERYDGSGHSLGAVRLLLRDVQLISFSRLTVYEGWREAFLEPGVRLANDNLQEFVRHIDLRGSAPQVLCWGIPSDHFADSPPLGNRVLSYDIVYSEYPKRIPLPYDPAGAAQNGTLKINIQSGGYAIVVPGRLPIYGRVNSLQLFGQFYQGVGGADVCLLAEPEFWDGPVGNAFAGFRNYSGERPAESGSLEWRGYAAAMAWNDSTPSVRELHSAAMASDNPAENEHRVNIQLDRDNATQPVSAQIVVSEMPPSPSPSDLVVANVQDGIFVEKYLYSGRAQVNNTISTLAGSGNGGKNWNWGIWDSATTIDMGGGIVETEKARGHYVVGDTLSPAAFQELVAGAQSYVLQTPAGQPGHVSATLTALPDHHAFLQGEAILAVNIPGSGAPPTWSGQFRGGQPGGDRFRIEYNTPRPISVNGHLQGGIPDVYSLNARGTSYGPATLINAETTGNLVGPGVGPRPITGAIGGGRFAHTDGTVLNLTYGTDLAP